MEKKRRPKEVPATFVSKALKEVPATIGSEALKEVPAGDALRACTFVDYFICSIPVVICKLHLVFCF